MMNPLTRRDISQILTYLPGTSHSVATRLTQARLQDIKRNGRSELDIVGEGLELVLRVVRGLEKGAWPRVVSEAVTSG